MASATLILVRQPDTKALLMAVESEGTADDASVPAGIYALTGEFFGEAASWDVNPVPGISRRGFDDDDADAFEEARLALVRDAKGAGLDVATALS